MYNAQCMPENLLFFWNQIIHDIVIESWLFVQNVNWNSSNFFITVKLEMFAQDLIFANFVGRAKVQN